MQTLKITKKEGYAILQLNRGKVNAINALMVGEFREAMKGFGEDEKIKGVIVSGSPHFFSAGLDVIELFDYDEKQIRDFFISFGLMQLELHRFPKPFVCAITGHCPAGGTIIAQGADYRIMADGGKYRIGLNEVAVNIQIDQNAIEAYSFWLGRRLAHQYIMEGRLLSPQEALSGGLVDQVVPLDQVMEKAEEKMKHYLMAVPTIFRNTKLKLRKSWLERLNDHADDELEQAVNLWFSDEVRGRMKLFVDRLAGR